MNTEALQERVRQGDKAAFALLVAHWQRPLFGFLGRMGLAQGQAEELAQEAFLRAWLHRARHDPARASWATWLFTIARNLALGEQGRAGHQAEQPLTEDAEARLADEAPGPVDCLVRRQTQDRVRQGLRTLSSEDRAALALAYIDDLTLADIARIEGCSTGAMKVRIHRARQRLRAWLEQHP